MKRRDFIAGFGGAVAWPVAARAQQRALPVVALVNGGSANLFETVDHGIALRQGLSEAGYVEGRNVTFEYHFLEGQYDGLTALMADLVRRRVAVIVTPGDHAASLAATAATATIPIVFGVADDPVRLGLVPSLSRPGGNATGFNYLFVEPNGQRLSLLNKLLPRAVRVAVLVNPAESTVAETTLQEVQKAARLLGLQIQVVNASTSREIEAAFAAMARDRTDALFMAPGVFFGSRHVLIATLAARDRIPSAGVARNDAAAGMLMSYGPDLTKMYHQLGVYTGNILKGAKPADLPVVQSVWSSTCKPRGCSASRCRQICSLSQTR